MLTLRPQLHVSEGTVVEYYPNGAAVCRSPCFQINGRVDHQKSGGPILSATPDGLLVVRRRVSTGFKVTDGDMPLSFGSMIFTAMALAPEVNRGTSVEGTFSST